MPGLRDAVETFVTSRPSLGDLAASRRSTFERAHCVLPADARPGERLAATVQARDEYERLFGFEGSLAVESTDPAANRPDRVDFPGPGPREGVREVTVAFETPGVHYLLLEDETGRRFVSNPVEVHDEPPALRRYWGDIHLHSRLSDGSGSMGKGFAFGRDVMALDVCAYTDHDTMGFFIPPRLQRRLMHRRNFAAMKAATREQHEPGEFVTLMAYEWTKQPNQGGHVNVYFEGVEEARLFDSLDRETDNYEKLWRRLRDWRAETGNDAVTIPHHPAEAMYPFDFSAVEYDDELAPLVEVYSQWGSSERPGREGNRMPLAMGQGEVDEPGHYVQDALRMGHRVGMLASADYHGPHPGHSLIHARPHLPALSDVLEDGLRWGPIWRAWAERSYPGGLTAFRTPELSREAIFSALTERRVYGTTQPDRILADFAVARGDADAEAGAAGGAGGGGGAGGDPSVDPHRVSVAGRASELRLPAPDAARDVEFRVAGTAPLESVTVVKNGEPWRVVEGTSDPDAALETFRASETVTDEAPVEGARWDDRRTEPADTYYLRVVQAGSRPGQPTGGMAWVGPLWVDSDDGST